MTVTVTDDDEPGVSISKAALEIEEGDSDTYEVALDTEPAGDVTVTIGGTTGTDLSLDPASLTFTEQNWDQPQTVTVTADHDRRRGGRSAGHPDPHRQFGTTDDL